MRNNKKNDLIREMHPLHPPPRARLPPDVRLGAVAFTAGVLAVHAQSELPGAGALALAAVPALWPWRLRAIAAALVLGALFTCWRAAAVLDSRWPPARSGEEHLLDGRIAGLPEAEGANRRFLFEPRDGAFPPRIRAGWYRAPYEPRAGECWRLRLRLRSPHGSFNPGGFDYEGWLFRQGIGATATVRAGEPCAAPAAPGIAAARQRVSDATRRALGEHPALPFIGALSVGERSGFSDADWEVFRLTGTTHLVAISGFNIAIVAGFALWLVRAGWSLWPRACLWLPAQRAGLLGAAVLSGVYALLAGFEPPVQRAVVMLWILLAAAWSHRRTQPSRVLAVAWLAVLGMDPLAVTSPGLWLSFAAVAAIFYVSLGRLRRPGPGRALVLLQLLLAAALAPVTLYFFQGASWMSPAVNLVSVPLFTLLTPWVLCGTGLALAWPAAGVPVLEAAGAVLGAYRAVLGIAASAPGPWLSAAPPEAALGLALAGIALLFAPAGIPLRLLGALCLVPLVAARPPAPAAALEATALDVGQGLSVVVRTPSHALVYDAGPAFPEGFDAGESVVVPFLLRHGIRAPDLLFLSHGDNDHAGGIAAVRRRLAPRRELGVPGAPPCREGQGWEWDGVHFEVLHPDPGGWSANDRSCVLRVRGAWTLLLAGDIEGAAERRLVERYGTGLRADVLVAPHHGSHTSSTAAFVAAVRPRVVVHAAGWRNHFRHPRPEVVARYGALGARQFVTGASGAVTVRALPGGDFEVEEWRAVARRFWNSRG